MPDKMVTSIYVDRKLNELTRKLKIDRALLVEMAWKQAVMVKLQTIEEDYQTLEQMAVGYVQEDKRMSGEIALIGQRFEQVEYAARREKEIREETGKKILQEYQNFCALHGLNDQQVTMSLTGDPECDFRRYDFRRYEKPLSLYLKEKGLPHDLNYLREYLHKSQNIPVVMQ